jgi:phage terminase small subunit
MPVLTNPRWERFAQEMAKGKSNTAAYVEAGFKARANSAAVNANKLLKNPNVSGRVAELLAERDRMHIAATEKATERLSIDRGWVIGKLVENVERAMQAVPVTRKENGEEVGTGEYRYEGSVANRALELLGKELGMFIDRKEQGAPGEFAELDNAADIRAAIARRLGVAEPGDGAVEDRGESRGLRSGPH